MKSSPLLLLSVVGASEAFSSLNIQLPNFFNFPSPLQKSTAANSAPNESELLSTIAFTANGKNANLATQSRVLTLVRQLETTYPPISTLLSDPNEAAKLDGDWFLQYTQPSEIDEAIDDKWVAEEASEGDARIDTRQFNAAGSVTASGIAVDTSDGNVAKQSFQIDQSRVTNEVMTGIGQVTVSGTYRQSKKVPLRAVVAFDTVRIALNALPLTLDLSFLFAIRGAIKGTNEAGWVETTYLSDDLRIGRGNKGSLFVLTRERDVVKP
jgi:hypothetical protein